MLDEIWLPDGEAHKLELHVRTTRLIYNAVTVRAEPMRTYPDIEPMQDNKSRACTSV
jgi:hypothetical protein